MTTDNKFLEQEELPSTPTPAVKYGFFVGVDLENNVMLEVQGKEVGFAELLGLVEISKMILTKRASDVLLKSDVTELEQKLRLLESLIGEIPKQ